MGHETLLIKAHFFSPFTLTIHDSVVQVSDTTRVEQ
jgi:hypothetical protein